MHAFGPNDLSPQKSFQPQFSTHGSVLRIDGSENIDNIRVIETVNSMLRVLGTIDGKQIDESHKLSEVGEIRIFGLGGDDTLENFTSVKSLINGGEGVDRIVGGDGNDVLLGEEGDDFITGRAGDDVMRGGAGQDKLYGRGGHDIIDGGGGHDDIRGNSGNDDMKGGIGNDAMRGGKGEDNIDGQDGDDSLLGQSDDDTLNGGAGEDRLRGGTGRDTLSGGDDSDVLRGEGDDDILNGDAGEDFLLGNSGNDVIFGGAGNDFIFGGDGNDALDGQMGDDILHGQGDDDQLFHDFQFDFVNGGGQVGDRISTRFHVDTTDDVDDGNFDPGNLSIREAIDLSDADDIILFDALTKAGPATITMVGGNDLFIDESITIQGTGDDLLTIDANKSSRIFNIASATNVNISGLTLTGGQATNGGGILVAGDVQIIDVTITNSKASSNGGGVYVEGNGSLNFFDGIINKNEADSLGGGVYIESGGTATFTFTSLNENKANFGGGIFNHGSLVVRDTTINANHADLTGGGVYQQLVAASSKIINSTISGNTADFIGGIRSESGTMKVTNSTLVFNEQFDEFASAAGLRVDSSTTTLNNTLVFGNLTNGSLFDLEGNIDTANSFNNLIGDSVNNGGFVDGQNGNIVGVADAKIDPVLSDNGGTTLTHALLEGSKAIDAGNNSKAVDENGFALPFDQTGNPRIQNNTVDIGSFETP